MDDLPEVQAYDEADFSQVNRRIARRALRLAAQPEGHALDLGTGPAEIPILLCQAAPQWRVTAVDLSANMLRAARGRIRAAGLDRRVRLVRSDIKSLRGVRRPFHLILSNSLLHHLADPLHLWHEVKRLATPRRGEDAIAVFVQDLLRPPSRREARRLVTLHGGDDPLLRQLFHQSLLAAFTTREVRAQLDAAGLQTLRVRKVSDRHLAVSGHVER